MMPLTDFTLFFASGEVRVGAVAEVLCAGDLGRLVGFAIVRGVPLGVMREIFLMIEIAQVVEVDRQMAAGLGRVHQAEMIERRSLLLETIW